MSELIYIYADESCLGNQYKDRDSPGGGAAMLEHWNGDRWHRRDVWISEPATTNNRMALASAARALEALKRPGDVVFTSDSQYLVKGMREWVPGWVRRNWRRKAGMVENVDLWKLLLREAARHRVDWRWVRGHAGHPQNEYANFLAIRAAREQTDSGGTVESGFEAWLEEEREKDRYFDFIEHAPPPEDEAFHPAPAP